MTEDSTLNISLNNKVVGLPEGTTLTMLLETYGYDMEKTPFAVAINNTFVPRDQYHQTRLNDHDKVDVLQPITGG